MQKVQPAKNTLDMDFLNSINKPLGGNAAQTTATVTAPVTPVAEKEPETIIDPVEMSIQPFKRVSPEKSAGMAFQLAQA